MIRDDKGPKVVSGHQQPLAPSRSKHISSRGKLSEFPYITFKQIQAHKQTLKFIQTINIESPQRQKANKKLQMQMPKNVLELSDVVYN